MGNIKYGVLQAAFRHRQNGKIIPTGAIHDTDQLPLPTSVVQDLSRFRENESDEEFADWVRNKAGLDDYYAEWEPGFVRNKNPTMFLDRTQAAKRVGVKGHLEAEGYDAQDPNPTLEHQYGTDSNVFKDSKVKKSERDFEALVKIDPELKAHLAKIRQVAPESARIIADKLFKDTMVPGVGNKAAYEDFKSRPRAGIHVMLDGNDFGVINKKWGQTEGDNAIKAMGSAIRRSSRSMGGKLFRVGGDEFRAHFDSPEQAYAFTRNVRNELDKLMPVRGVHKHSVSIGLGHSPEHSEQALIQAKNAKKSMNYAPGTAQTHAHSLLEGAAGPVPLGHELPPPGFESK